MPILEQVEVRVVVGSELSQGETRYEALQEWGTQHMRGGKKVSTYVEAETGKAFRILIKPHIPYIPKDSHAAHDYNTRTRAKAREVGEETDKPGFFRTNEDFEDMEGEIFTPNSPSSRGLRRRPEYRAGTASRYPKGAGHNRSDAEQSESGGKTKHDSGEASASFSSPCRSHSFDYEIPPPPYHFLASLYLDGRDKPERRVIVYLDPYDEDYNKPNGEVAIKTRWAQGKDGTLKEQAWVFKDVGIETMFDKLIIAGDIDIATPIPKRSEDALVEAMNIAYLSGDADMIREEKSKVGQIVVVIERVKLGEKWRDHHFRAKHEESEYHDVDMQGVGKDITHTAGLSHLKTIPVHPVRVVSYVPHHEGEGPFATFQFFYRSKETLAKFNFGNFNRDTRRPLRPRRGVDDPFRTPLTIRTNITSSSASHKRKDRTFEEMVKTGSPNNSQEPEFHFESSYRSREANHAMENTELPSKGQPAFQSPLKICGPAITDTSSASENDGEVDDEKSGAKCLPETASESPHTPNLSPGATPSPLTKPVSKRQGNNVTFNLAAPVINVSHSSDLDESCPAVRRKTRPSTPFLPHDNDYRTLSGNASDADDEFEKSEQETHHGSDTEDTTEDSPVSADKDDHGLSHKVEEQLILGKRSRSTGSTEISESVRDGSPITSPEEDAPNRRVFEHRNALDDEGARRVVEHVKKRARVSPQINGLLRKD